MHTGEDNCPHCAKLMPVKDEVMRTLRGHGFTVLDVHMILQMITTELICNCEFHTNEERLEFHTKLADLTRQCIENEIKHNRVHLAEYTLQ